jgi:hypothetical protein
MRSNKDLEHVRCICWHRTCSQRQRVAPGTLPGGAACFYPTAATHSISSRKSGTGSAFTTAVVRAG